MDDSTLTDAQKTKILARFSNLKDKIVMELFDAPFWKNLSAQNNILVSSNQRQLKNNILLEAITTASEESAVTSGSQKSAKISSQKNNPKEIIPIVDPEVNSLSRQTDFIKNVNNKIQNFLIFLLVSPYVRSKNSACWINFNHSTPRIQNA